MTTYSQLWYLPLGLIPSILWLLYYLRKDVHPEPNRLVIRVFLLGMLAAPLAAFIGFGADGIKDMLPVSETVRNILFIFIGVGLVEEYMKYYVVSRHVVRDPEFDEPTDAMIYLIISALGFAALENMLVVSPAGNQTIASVAHVLTIRFFSATFLHALASGIVGYFLALAILRQIDRSYGILFGLLIAATLHGVYNYAILYLDTAASEIFILTMLACMAVGVAYAFRRLRRICFLILPARASRQHSQHSDY